MGFTLKETAEVPKLALKAMRFQHSETNLNHIHIHRPDQNRVFALAFKTQAPDKTGVPHILEHTTLCGSHKYPVRDPFFKMQTRSLANYMNALTGTDYTYYPFATTNKQDFINLQSVYTDSVFNPLLKEQDFNQEGWRLENADVNDPKSPIVFKGVVFNEMKGQMSMPAYYFWTSYFQAIYPSLQYSAGDPLHIPDLTYENLVNFHHSKYHPDNCFTFSYGDFDPSESLDPLDKYLTTVRPGSSTKADITKAQPEPISLDAPVKVVAKGPVDPMYDSAKQHKASLTWYVGSPNDVTHTLAWRVLGLLLTDGHASPFYQSLIDTGIATEFTYNTGMEDTPAKLMFTIGAQGLSKDSISTFKQVVFETLEKIIASGFDQTRIDAIIHQAELSDREMDANFGMSMLGRVVSRVFHPNDDVMRTLDNDELLGKFKALVQNDPSWFQNQLKEMIKSNYFEFIMEPSAEFEKDLAAKESDLLQSRVAKLEESDKAAIFERGKDLETAQNAHQDVELLPKVTPDDISKVTRDFPVSSHKFKDCNVVVRETPLQGLSYVNIMRDVSHIDKSLIPFLQIYTDALVNVGTHRHNMSELEDLIKLQCGNLSVNAGTRELYQKPLGLDMSYGTYGLDSKLPSIYELLEEVALHPKFENVSKIKSLIDGSAGNIMNSLSQSGHSYAVGKSSAAISKRKALNSMMGGFPYVKQLKSLSQLNEDQLKSQLLPTLEKIHAQSWNVRGAISCSPGTLGIHTEPLSRFLSAVKANPSDGEGVENIELGAAKSYVPLPFQVSYVGCSISGPNYEDPDSAALTILANLMSNRFLHTEIREKGGAYGGGASYDTLGQLLNFYSYRDPNPLNSLETIAKSGKWATEHKWTDTDVAEGKVGVFQGIDSPISPRAEIGYAIKSGLSLELRKQRREHLLAVQPSDLNRVAEKYLVPKLADFNAAGLCVIGPSGEGLDGFNTEEI